jgi:Recombination enhancement, RecA-dependent nuclease
MTKEQKAFQALARDLGCIVCKGEGIDSPCEIHHILSGSRRLGEDYVLGLCQIHHRGLINTPEAVSRHPWRREFEARYGTEMELLEKTRELCGERRE